MAIEKLRPVTELDEQRIKQLKQIIPEAFADQRINWETLKEALGNFTEEENADAEHFGLFWPGKRDARKLAGTPSRGTLVPVPGEGLNEDITRNIFIEGENLEVLKLLQKSYAGRIKLIYIDPPYNTGNDFVYDDNFTETIEEYLKRTGQIDEEGRKLITNTKADGRFHSKWLSMMFPRLRLARNLLSDDGFIFISIDENEVANLKQLMNEIFGEENFISSVSNINNPKGRSDDKYVATAHEYLLIYKKDNGILSGFDPEEKVIRRYNKINGDKRYREIDLRKTGEGDRKEDRPNMFYFFYYDEKTKAFFPSYDEIKDKKYIKITPTRQDGSLGRWRWGFDTAKNNIERIYPKFMEVRKKWTVVEMDYLTDDEVVKPTSAWTFKDVNSERGTEQFIELGFDKEIFPKPKPLGLIKRVLKISTKPLEENIVLDFFAGSGSLAHAVMEFNKEVDGNIRHISVQLPEIISEEDYAYRKGYRNIAQISKDRIRKAAKKIMPPQPGFKSFVLRKSNYKLWQNIEGADVKKLELAFEKFESPLIDNWKEDDLLTEVVLIEGFPLDCTIKKEEVYRKNKVLAVTSDFHEHRLLICLDKKVSAETIKALQLNDDDIFICLDNAITDEQKITLSDKGLIKTI